MTGGVRSGGSSGHWRRQLLRLPRRASQAVYRRLYRDSDHDVRRSVMIAGTARSGTTWLAEIIAAELSCRLMFEPFHSELVDDFSRFEYFQYMRAEEENEPLLEFAAQVFSGRVRHPWIDRYADSLRPRMRVIKEIRANLFLRWLNLRYPEVPLVFVVRHPCAVVASRLSLGWGTDTDLASILAQPKLVEDFLADHMEFVERATRPEEKHAIVWCVTNLVPLRQFPREALELVFYEDICLDPEPELARVFRALGHPHRVSAHHAAGRTSMTARRDSHDTARQRVEGWRYELDPAQIEAVENIVNGFGLGGLYGDQTTPLASARRASPGAT